MSKKSKRLLILVLVGCLALAGCGKKAQRAAGAGREATILMWLIGSEGQAQTIKELAEDFYKRTSIKVKCDAISWGEAHSKYLTSIAGGVAPDIGTMGLTWGSEFGSIGSMVDLKAAYPEDVRAMEEQVFEGLWRSIQCGGKVYGIPFDMTEYVMYYLKDAVAKPPETWDELTALLAELNVAGKSMIFDWGSISWIGYSPFLWQAGGDYFNSDYTEVTVDSPEAVAALKFFAELYIKYNVPETKIPLEQGMRTGDFPIAISGNWKIDSLRLLAPEITGRWAIATLPKGPTGKKTAFIGGRILGIFTQSKHQAESWEFIKYLFTPEVQKKLYEAAFATQETYLPPSRKTWDILEMDPDFKRVLVEQANDAKGPPPVANWDAYSRYIDEPIQRVVLQGADPKTELDAAKKNLVSIMEK